MIRFWLSFFILTTTLATVSAQPYAPLAPLPEQGYRHTDYIYQDNIATVQLRRDGLEISYPMLDLGGMGRLLLTFDDLDGDVKNYFYTIVHCDATWEPSRLTELDYIDGFAEGDITDYDFSFNTETAYTHYRLMIPNQNLRLKVSGNYVLRVFHREEGEERTVLTRRFMVVEPVVSIAANFARTQKVSQSRTHHEIDFVVEHKGFEIPSPRRDIVAHVLQNGRWDNAILNLKPMFVRNERLEFDFAGKIVFPAGKEYRYLDLRSLRFRTDKVESLGETEDGFLTADLKCEGSREDRPFFQEEDLNGMYFIENFHENNDVLQSDYADVTFCYAKRYPYEQQDLYLYGAFTDWKINEDFRLRYNPAKRAYYTTALLKQGFYNYMYALVPRGGITPTFAETEGSWFETENDYTILVYYRPFGERYDRLISATTINSADF